MKYAIIAAICSINYFSFSQNIVWSTPVDVATSTFGNEHPRVVTDADGNALILWGQSSTEKAHFSRWNGTMFTAPVALNPMNMPVAAASWMGPDIASHGDTVYVVYKKLLNLKGISLLRAPLTVALTFHRL